MAMGRPRLIRTNCLDCDVVLDDSNSVIYAGYNKGRCRTCYNKLGLRGYNFERDRAHNLKRKFGMTLEDYSTMFNAQGGKCAICDQPSDKTLHVDHNHTTGDIRGLLCHRCNRSLGFLGEDPEIIMNMYEYLMKWAK